MNENAAIYLRLSRDDRNEKKESESISNQRLLLQQFAASRGIRIKYEFSDDGVSGTKWNRDAFQELLQMISTGQIDTVLVKDLSRLSRDYIQTGNLVENWLPAHGIRFISVDDGIDTGKSTDRADFFPFRAVMDDWYARDISRKVRAAIYAKQRAGYCTASALPFGFERNGDKIVINTAKAELVKRIFYLCQQGISCCRIAEIMNIETVSGKNWNETSIRRLLRNTAYIGKLRLHTTQKLSYKSDYRIKLPSDDAIEYPVSRIISDQEFDSAQEMLNKRRHMRKPRHWLSGRVHCAVCGANMYISASGREPRVICGARKRGGLCKNPSVLVYDLRKQLETALAELPPDESIYRRAIESIMLSPENIVIQVKYRK